jgi:dephospho-CoA kinase
MAAVTIVDPSAEWAEEFQRVAADLWAVLAGQARSIRHIGSTAVPGLAAKDVIDVQVGVTDQASLERVMAALEGHGYRVVSGARDHPVPGEVEDDAAWRKGFATERPGDRRANVHVRIEGALNHTYALLFVAYLRQHPDAAVAYGTFKKLAARMIAGDVDAYTELKDPVCDLVYLPAKAWAIRTGWTAER